MSYLGDFHLIDFYSVVPRPAVSATPGNLFKISVFPSDLWGQKLYGWDPGFNQFFWGF